MISAVQTVSGRLHNNSMALATDPRLDPRLRWELGELGMLDLAPPAPASRHDDKPKLISAVAAANDGFNAFYESLPDELPGDRAVPFSLHNVTGVEGNIVRLRVYLPEQLIHPAPCVVYLHGGGMTILDAFAKVHHRWCQDLALAGMVVVSVDFRNAYTSTSLNPFPSGLNDCLNAILWVAARKKDFGISSIIVQGESGGANLTIATTLKAKEVGCLDAIDGAYASVPFISGGYRWDVTRKMHELPSLIENDGYFMNCGMMDMLAVVYDPNDLNTENPQCWPYFATLGELEDLPPYVVSVNELDPLRDEGVSFYRKLLASGVTARGRMNFGITHAAELIFRRAIPDIRRAAIADIRDFAIRL